MGLLLCGLPVFKRSRTYAEAKPGQHEQQLRTAYKQSQQRPAEAYYKRSIKTVEETSAADIIAAASVSHTKSLISCDSGSRVNHQAEGIGTRRKHKSRGSGHRSLASALRGYDNTTANSVSPSKTRTTTPREKQSTTSSAVSASLLSLPLELREQIYGYCLGFTSSSPNRLRPGFSGKWSRIWPLKTCLALSHTCRQLHAEVLPAVCNRFSLYLLGSEYYRRSQLRWAKTLGAKMVPHVRSFHLASECDLILLGARDLDGVPIHPDHPICPEGFSLACPESLRSAIESRLRAIFAGRELPYFTVEELVDLQIGCWFGFGDDEE